MSDLLQAKSEVFSHLLHAHDVLLTLGEFHAMSLDDLKALDPCEVSDGV